MIPDLNLLRPAVVAVAPQAGPLPQLIEEMKMWCTQTLHTLASCHLTFTSPIFTQRGTLGQRQARGIKQPQLIPPLLPWSTSLEPIWIHWWCLWCRLIWVLYYLHNDMSQLRFSHLQFISPHSFRTHVWCVLFGCVCRKGSVFLLTHLRHFNYYVRV